MTSRKGKKPGRPANRVFDPHTGDLVVGLSLESDKTGGYYYAVGTDPRKRFGRELVPAIRLFRMWQAEQEGTVLKIPEPKPRIEVRRTQSLAGRPGLSHPEFRIKTHSDVSKEGFLEELSRWLEDPVKRKVAAQVTGHPLDRLETLSPPSKPISLDKALENYLGKLKPISVAEKKQVQMAWKHFCNAMGVGTLQTITLDAIEEWAKGLYETHSVKFAKNRIRRIITVIRYNLKKRKDETGCRRVLDYLGTLETPSSVLLNPKPISKQDFHKLLVAAKGSVWEAFLLVGLNCCYYGIDLVRLPVSAVNLKEGTIVFVREKTNIPRVAVLWDRTVKALEGVLKGRENRKWVFENYRKTHWTSVGFCDQFDKLRGKAGFYTFLELSKARKQLKDGDISAEKLAAIETEMAARPRVEFSQIRDGAYTAACSAGVPEKEAKILAGHRISGESDAYVLRNPQMVKHACAAIEAHYFDKSSLTRVADGGADSQASMMAAG